MTNDRENIRFNALRNALYHTARRRTLERWNRIFNFLVVVLGAAAIGDVVTVLHLPNYAIGMTVAVIGALQLVFDYGRQARDHQALQRDYYGLLAEIEANLAPTPEDCATWYSKMIRITSEEPPVLRAVDAKAYNDAIDGLGTFERDQRLHIPFHHRFLGGLVSFEGYEYAKLQERGAKALPKPIP